MIASFSLTGAFAAPTPNPPLKRQQQRCLLLRVSLAFCPPLIRIRVRPGERNTMSTPGARRLPAARDATPS